MSQFMAKGDMPTNSALPGSGPRFFDRFYFNLHGHSPTPLVMLGAGIYPQVDTVDGYVIVVDSGVQRNLRFSDRAGDGTPTSVGPLSWEVVEPLKTWRLSLGPNPAGLEMEVLWQARSSPWETPPVVLDDGSGGRSSFDHFFQSGRYTGEMWLDGQRTPVDNWLGQRDRSRGVRPVSGGQGLHLWVQAQMNDYTLSFMLDEDRGHEVTLLDGAILSEDGSVDPAVNVEHALSFDDDLDFRHGRIRLETRSGAVYDVEVDGSSGGGFLSGGGYGGWHGEPRGEHQEGENWPLDGSVHPRMLDTPLTDRPSIFHCRGEKGVGVFEFAHSRSEKYRYRPSLR